MRYILIVLLIAACGKRVDLKKEGARYDAYLAALPDLRPVPQDQPVELSVLQVRNSRLPDLEAKEVANLYSDVEILAKKVFGYSLRIKTLGSETIESYFDRTRGRLVDFPIAYPAAAFPISYFAKNRDEAISEVFVEIFKNSDKKKIVTYLGKVNDPAQATREFVEKLKGALAGPDLTGRALLSEKNPQDEPYYSYGHWSSILQGEKQADFILTNTGIIGADNGMPLYVVARGGVTNAFVENNAYRPHQGAGVVGMYPFLSDTPYFIEKRGKLSSDEKREAIAWLWLHELGHLLLKKEENYTYLDSVHRAPATLKYSEWVKAIRATQDHHTKNIKEMKKF